MGYTTDFSGELKFDKPLTPEQVKYIQAFNETRRMKRDAKIAETFPDPLRIAVGLPIGDDGCYYVGSTDDHGQGHDASILNYNAPPGIDYSDFNRGFAEEHKLKEEGKYQPGLWCQWTVNDEGTIFEWDGGEKFYDYIEWLKYLINHFFNKWGVKLNGEIFWEGEDSQDMGKIEVIDSIVTIKNAKISYE